MSKVTSKLQVTLPKKVAEQYDIRPGQDIEFAPAGDSLRVVLPGARTATLTTAERLELFDRATARLRALQRGARRGRRNAARGWARTDLYDRGRSR